VGNHIDWDWLMSGTDYDSSKEFFETFYLRSKWTVKNISIHLGVTEDAIRRRMLQDGINIRPRFNQ